MDINLKQQKIFHIISQELLHVVEEVDVHFVTKNGVGVHV